MKTKSPYILNIIGLSIGEHDFEFEFDKTIFDHKENEDINDIDCKILLHLKKTSYHINATISITGITNLTCDRSLEKYNQKIDTHDDIIFKYSDQNEEIEDNLYHITHSLESIDFSDIFYELIAVQIPMKKIHPKHLDESDLDDNAEEVLIYSSNDSEIIEENTDICDSRWESLKKFKLDNDKIEGKNGAS